MTRQERLLLPAKPLAWAFHKTPRGGPRFAWFVVPFAIFGIGSFIWAHSQAETAAAKKAEWHSVEGKISAHGAKASSESQPSLRKTWLSYKVNGQSYRMETELQWDTPLGSQVEVWYHPDHPSDGRQYAPSSLWEQGGPWLFSLFSVLLCMGMISYMLKALDVFYEPLKKPPTLIPTAAA